ncbi:MAG TPA: hypothetical protein VFQ36_19855 [Ktedonobacteraceae bacterium]|nr:hypothetical protein [Ktedonobacteraceae bacterium]
MKRQRLCLLISLLCISLAACTPGHVGGNEIAFVRDGHLWTIDPNGANIFEVVSDNAPVIGYAWSPDHQIFAFRELDSRYARTPAGKNLQSNPLTGLPGDLPASLNTVSIDGGMPIPIIGSSFTIQYSNAWWNSDGNRLLYRGESTHGNGLLPLAASWYVSQDDQPNGIARKSLPSTYSIPSFNPDSSMAIGNSQQGMFTTTLAGTNLHQVTQEALPGHPLPASLERILWQPAHSHPLLLYAVTTTRPPQSPASNPVMPAVQLVLNNGSGEISSIATCYCTQFSWSPDGNSVLYSVGATYSVYNIATHSAFSFSGENGSVPYWSPDSRMIVLDGLHTLSLITIASQTQQNLLSDTITDAVGATIPDANALMQPVSNSLWAADSQHFLILTRGRLFWQGKKLTSGDGIYTVALDHAGQVHDAPSVVDTGHDSQPGWSFENPNTSFLFL